MNTNPFDPWAQGDSASDFGPGHDPPASTPRHGDVRTRRITRDDRPVPIVEPVPDRAGVDDEITRPMRTLRTPRA